MKRRTSKTLFEVRTSTIHGTGAFATSQIRKGTRIIEYVGERISHEEADHRYMNESRKDHHTFLFAVDKKTCIDAAVDGNDARFINHSCQPNCAAYNVNGRIFIEAIRTIEAGTELTYDYAFEMDEPDTPSVRKRYACRCGSIKCRGTLLKRRRKRKNIGALRLH